MTRLLATLVAAALIVQGCAHGRAVGPPAAGLPAEGQRGKASYYGASLQGHKTASGEPFDLHALTAAHRTLPFGTRVRVTNLANGRQVVVRINDRGPYVGGRIIDLSEEAARRLDCIGQGVADVRIERVPGDARGAASP
jgi:rare lipoprotein A